LLHTIVGGDWSQDNDLDWYENKVPIQDSCLCYYGSHPAMCAKSGFEDTMAKYGVTFWVPLPRSKNYSNHNLPGRWYATYWDPSFNSYDHTFEHWGDWRDNVIEDVSVFDQNDDGDISLREFLHTIETLEVNQQWFQNYKTRRPCEVVQAFEVVRILRVFLPEVRKGVMNEEVDMATYGHVLVDKYQSQYKDYTKEASTICESIIHKADTHSTRRVL